MQTIILDYIRINPFLFALGLLQFVAMVHYMLNKPTKSQLKVAVLMFLYSLSSFCMIGIL